MPTYVGLLRGVNVGGKNNLPMADLRALCASLGFRDVTTFIQSGNVVFKSEATPRPSHLEDAIKQHFDITTTVVLRTSNELEKILLANPFSAEEKAHLHVAFVALDHMHGLPTLDGERYVPERFVIIGSEIYLYLPNGVARSKLPIYLDRQLRTRVTLRNWNTVEKLADLART
jgi:uncharacterized protein (DUF1697 family)